MRKEITATPTGTFFQHDSQNFKARNPLVSGVH